MSDGRAVVTSAMQTLGQTMSLPPVITDAGERAGRRFLEFFAASIRHPNTRAA